MTTVKKCLVLLVMGVLAAESRPEVGSQPPSPGSSRQGKAQSLAATYLDSANLPAEAKSLGEEKGGVKKLSYYGGALGRFLLVEPSGRTQIVGERRPPGGPRDESEEEDVGVAEEGPTYEDTVAINHPPENASIAEARPVAVSVAGVGGVASAQPVATAVVGPGGLAVSRPVATAVSGIEGAHNLVSIIGGGKEADQPHPHHSYTVLHHPALLYYTLPIF